MKSSEAAIVSAYTGYLIGDFSLMHEYCEKILGRPIWTHQFPELRDEIREKSKDDFVGMEVDDED